MGISVSKKASNGDKLCSSELKSSNLAKEPKEKNVHISGCLKDSALMDKNGNGFVEQDLEITDVVGVDNVCDMKEKETKFVNDTSETKKSKCVMFVIDIEEFTKSKGIQIINLLVLLY